MAINNEKSEIYVLAEDIIYPWANLLLSKWAQRAFKEKIKYLYTDQDLQFPLMV